LLNDALKLPDT